MRIVDANVLLYAVNAASDHHGPSRAWLRSALNGRETIGVPWQVQLAFLRISTKVGLFPRPLAVPDALQILAEWTARATWTVPEPTARHLTVLSDLLRATGTGGNLVNDAHLAALALEHGASVVTWDSDFARFPGVRVAQPSVPAD